MFLKYNKNGFILKGGYYIMKQFFSILLSLCLMLGMVTLATAEENTGLYQLGDHVEDFSFTMVDGTEGTLYGLLAEKKVVLLNLWATWCMPCRAEFPAMEAAYEVMKDDAAFVCLSVEEKDDAAAIQEMRDEIGLTTLPMGKAPEGLAQHFTEGAIPTTVVIDRNGVLCFLESGTMPDKNKFIRLLETFTADDYSEPVLLTEVPAAVSRAEVPDMAQARAALSLTDDMTLAFPTADDAMIWPFVLNDDGTALAASNGSVRGTVSAFTLSMSANAGEGLSLEYQMDAQPTYQSLKITVDGKQVEALTGKRDWTEFHFAFAKDGEHTVKFEFIRDDDVDGDDTAAVRAIRKVSAEELTALDAEKPNYMRATALGMSNGITLVDGAVRGVQGFMGAVPLMVSDTLTFAITVNSTVDVEHAFVQDRDTATMLRDMPYVGGCFLYVAKRQNIDYAGSLNSARNLSLCDDVRTQRGYAKSLATFVFYQDEEGIQSLAELMKAFASMYGATASDEDFAWSYLDGGAVESAETTDVAVPELNEDGTANYTVLVKDSSGNAVEGAMVQVCDETTCQVFFTDAEGKVAFAMMPYAYEVHILKAPEGLKVPEDVMHVPAMGGELEVVLEQE